MGWDGMARRWRLALSSVGRIRGDVGCLSALKGACVVYLLEPVNLLIVRAKVGKSLRHLAMHALF